MQIQSQTCTALALIKDTPPDLGLLFRYHTLKSLTAERRRLYSKTYNQVLAICNLYYSRHESLTKEIKRLRHLIRINTRGMPDIIGQDAITNDAYLSSTTQQLYNANSHLLKTAWKMVRRKLHPDVNSGEVTELFKLAKNAYEIRDFTYLQELWLMLDAKDGLHWCCSAGVRYFEQEVTRPSMSLSILKTTDEFKIMQAHASGHPEKAELLAVDSLHLQLRKLHWELHNLLVKPKTTA